MKKQIILITVLLFSLTSIAGPGHSHGHGHRHAKKSTGSNEKDLSTILELGKLHVTRLSLEGKIDLTWKNSNLLTSNKKKFNSKNEWLLTYRNEQGVKGKKLYIFLKVSGEFVAANFTGK